MKTGTDQVKHKVLHYLKKYKAVLRGAKYGEFADELTAEIMKLIGDDMRNKEWDDWHGFPEELRVIVTRLERFLNLRNMMRDERAVEVYQWIAEQESAGKTIAKFADWALQPERAQFVGKYKKTPEAIKTDWALAFGETKGTMVSLMETL